MKPIGRGGMTLMEILIGTIVGSLMLLGLSSIAINSMRSSAKGTAHLTNAHAASVFLRGLELDLNRAVTVTVAGNGLVIDAVRDLASGRIATETIRYSLGNENLGFQRQAGAEAPARFCEDLCFEPADGAPMFAPVEPAAGGHKGLRVRFKVRARRDRAHDKAEEMLLERFYLCGNDPGHPAVPGRVR